MSKKLEFNINFFLAIRPYEIDIREDEDDIGNKKLKNSNFINAQILYYVIFFEKWCKMAVKSNN
uniref:Uncharacterized protein n=1 Tax=Romanomermis culicivorax TaxID=13658 RepID=A0A915L9L4_ROMCU